MSFKFRAEDDSMRDTIITARCDTHGLPELAVSW